MKMYSLILFFCLTILLFIVFVLLVYFLDSIADAYNSIGPIIMVCQMASILEIVHPLLGWVKTGALMPLIQVCC
jgi:hypothetical protein